MPITFTSGKKSCLLKLETQLGCLFYFCWIEASFARCLQSFVHYFFIVLQLVIEIRWTE